MGMKILIASDIFGDSETHLELCKNLNQQHIVTSVTPYAVQNEQFINEHDAYQAFLAAGGMASYSHKISQLADTKQFDIVLGFSAGGAAIWAAQSHFIGLKKGVAFYPGQIRDYLSLSNTAPWDLVFACRESHFDQNPVLNQLADKKKVCVVRSPFEHGFINQRSSQYNQTESDFILSRLQIFLSEQNSKHFADRLPKNYKKLGKPAVAD